MSAKTLPQLIQELSPDEQKTVREFVEFLLTKRRHKKRRFLRQNWAGALREYREHYTPQELERRALEWRTES